MTRSTTFAPATPSGGILRLIGASCTDDEAFVAKSRHEQSQINVWRADPAGPSTIINQSSSIASGRFGFISIRHPMGGRGRPEVTVFHTVRAYMANRLELTPVDVTLKDKAYAFAGEIYVDEGLVTLPSVVVQLENLKAILTPQVVKVPTEEALVAAWGAYDEGRGGDGEPRHGRAHVGASSL